MPNADISSTAHCWLSLSLHEKRSPAFWKNWLAHNSLSLTEAFSLSDKALLDTGLTGEDSSAFDLQRDSINRALAWQAHAQHRYIIDFDHPLYPALLKELTSPPLVLFCEGNPQLLSQRQVAIVGSRRATLQGLSIATEFAAELGEMGLTITSGLALGIDGAAHKGACGTSGNTIAVMGGGLEQMHPKSHVKLAQQMLAGGGCMVSEFAPWVIPKPYHFPRRNRIIAAMSEAVLVIEAKIKSGSMITANLAADAGKDVFAIPGNIKHPLTAGPHYLIQQGATLTTCVPDILFELGMDVAHSRDADPAQSNLLWEELQGLLAHVDTEFTSVDDISTRSGMPVAQVMADMLEFEIAGKVVAVPGGYRRSY